MNPTVVLFKSFTLPIHSQSNNVLDPNCTITIHIGSNYSRADGKVVDYSIFNDIKSAIKTDIGSEIIIADDNTDPSLEEYAYKMLISANRFLKHKLGIDFTKPLDKVIDDYPVCFQVVIDSKILGVIAELTEDITGRI